MIPKFLSSRRAFLVCGGAILILLIATHASLYAAPEPFLIELKKLTAGDPVVDGLFGYSVAVSGETAVVGALMEDRPGSAYVFERNSGGAGNWEQIKKLTASDGTADNWFGRSAAISGHTIVISSFLTSAVYIFERNAGGANNWGETRKLTPPVSAAGFGSAVSIDNDTLIVGASGNDSFTSLVFVFERNVGGPNNWGLRKTLTPSDPTNLNLFGHAVSIRGDSMVVGAPGAEVGGSPDQGGAYVFDRNNGGANNWGEVRKIVSSDGAANDQFGCSVSIDGNTIVAGAKRQDVGANADQGAAYVFERDKGDPGNWGQTTKIVSSGADSRDLFGSAVAVSGNRIVVGRPFRDTGELFGVIRTLSGRAYVFDRDLGAPGNWGEFQILHNGPSGHQFGASVAIDGMTLLVGAPGEKIGTNNNQGSACLFVPVPGPNPAIRGRTITAKQGQGTGGAIATVGDDTTPPGNLVATVISSPPGLTAAFLNNDNGRIGAAVTIDCNVPVGTYSIGLQVTDPDGLSATDTATVIVTGNSAPVLGNYSPARVGLGGSVTVVPSAAPTTASGGITASAPGFAGALAVNVLGRLTVSNAGPPGDYTVTVTTTDNCGASASKTFTLTVLPELTTITVNTAADTTADDGSCSLREAIAAANTNSSSGNSPGECVAGLSGTDRIAFNIPGAGPHVILPGSSLPDITEPVLIEGGTQPGATTDVWPHALKIVLNGSNLGASANGLTFALGSQFSSVRGLVINGFGGAGIRGGAGNLTIQGNFIGTDVTGTVRLGNGIGVDVSGSNLIGGETLSARNLISGNKGTGVAVLPATESGSRVQGNFIGTDVTGTLDLGNEGSGVTVGNNFAKFTSALVGGASPDSRNIISGNDQEGIVVTNSNGAARIEGNFIGTDVTGTRRLGNSANGIWARVGLGVPITDNVISANGAAGVKLGGTGTTPSGAGEAAIGCVLNDNYIGTDATGASNFGNDQDGVLIVGDSTSNNYVGRLIGTASVAGTFVPNTNVIAFNGRDGVRVEGNARQNSIAYNSIFNNTGLALNLGPDGATANDPGDSDTGPNGLQNFPVLGTAITDGATSSIHGILNSKPNSQYTIQFFSSPACGVADKAQGKVWLSENVVTTDASGHATINAGLPAGVTPGHVITATATLTDPLSDPDWISTSEFSPCQIVEGIGASPLSQLLNISTRLRVLSGENVLIGGFIITGTDAKKVIIRGIGPSLAQFFNGTLDDPLLELYQGNTLIDGNNDWKTNEAAIAATGIPPSHDLESAIVRTLSPGAYTAILRGNTNAPGIGLVEAYDLDQGANSKLANISTRGFVDSGDNVMIGGFIIGGGDGGATVVVRAIGPALGNFGINGALQNPTLDLVDANGMVLRANNNWKDSQRTEIESVGLPPGDDRECALIQTLAPGNYTAIVRGEGNTTGVGLVEVYNVE